MSLDAGDAPDFAPAAAVPVPRSSASAADTPVPKDSAPSAADPTPAYAELQVTSNFSFLRGASHPEELIERACAMGFRAVALTDRNTLAGVVRAYHAAKQTKAKEAGLRFIAGARLDLEDGPSLLCLPTTRAGYGRLARLITDGRRRAPKGECRLWRADVVCAVRERRTAQESTGNRQENEEAGNRQKCEAAGSRTESGERWPAPDQVFVVVPPEEPGPDFPEQLAWYRERLDAPLYLAATHYRRGDDDRRLARLAALADAQGVLLVATGDVEMHDPARRRLHDVLACARERCTIDAAGRRLAPNADRHLKTPAEMARLFRNHPQALANAVEVAERCRFSLGELRYEYPDEVSDDGRPPQEKLEALAWEGAARRWPDGVPSKVRAAVEQELALIGRLGYAPYFLTVDDIVRTARGLGILCQGRGSAANSAVCYCLGITSVDPTRIDLLFERFISAERDEPPDIDVDFEHERREEVVQYIYRKYGRERAGLTATVITYRTRSALRDVGKAMGLSKDVIDRLLSQTSSWSGPVDEARAKEEGLDPSEHRLALTLALADELRGFPRHLSQHTGGFVVSRGPLCEIVPIQNAAMADRTVIEWNKDDLEALGLVKVDVLGLGMLSCIRRSFELLEAHHGVRHTLASVPQEDPAVYEMIQRADTVGVFQIESRAQMAMLPRLKPATFYDLVIEIAIVRPGPIQGDMVHPYLRRRKGVEPVRYPSDELRQVLEKTLGVPLFQEQAMKVAIVAAGFAPAEADQLRRAMASFRNYGTVHRFRDKFVEGMTDRGYDQAFAERCFRQIEGFGDYGFPESHAASFALLAYVSSWLKRHYPEVFACALLNSQPMGFYAPAQIVRDARDHGVEVRPADVNHSAWECVLEPMEPAAPAAPAESVESRTGEQAGNRRRGPGRPFALRLGLRQIKGLRKEEATLVAAARGDGYWSPEELWRRSGVSRGTLVRLANADALVSMGLDRRQAAWAAGDVQREGSLPLFDSARPEVRPDQRPRPSRQSRPDRRTDYGRQLSAITKTTGSGTSRPSRRADHGRQPQPVQLEPALPAMSAGEHVAADYRATGLSLKRHPVAFLRERLARRGVRPTEELARMPDGARVAVAGIVLVRQRPGTAREVVFVTLEDETGTANLVVFPSVRERWRRDLLTARLMVCRGKVQAEDGVIHVIAEKIEALNGWLENVGRAEGDSGGKGCDGAVGRSAFVDRGRFFH